MTDKNQLEESIAQAEAHLQKSMDAASSPVKVAAVRSLPLLVIIVLVLLGFKWLVTDATSRSIRQDIAISALDLFMEADASVINYYNSTLRLPDTLPAAALVSLVNYRRLDNNRYVLSVRLVPHDTEIERNIAMPSPPEDIETRLKL